MQVRYFLFCLLFTIAGCGGGGGSDSPAPTPSVSNDAVTTNQDTAVTINVLANDSSVNSTTLKLAANPGHGTATITNSSLTYLPEAGYAGTDSFSYSVTGTDGSTLTGTVTVNVNALPIATPDSFTVVINTPTPFDILANDRDADGTLTGGITITTEPTGTLDINANDVVYTPPDGFTGIDSFSYQVADNSGAESNSVTVSISVNPITVTTLNVSDLAIPVGGYTTLNNAALGDTVLSSPAQKLTIAPNTVSYTLMLSGNDVNLDQNGLFISNLEDPAGVTPNELFRNVIVCDTPLCTADIPKRPGITPGRGNWQFRLGTLAQDLSNINFSDMHLALATRVGPLPDLSAPFPATFHVHLFLTATSVSQAQFQTVSDALVQLAASNQINLVIDDTTTITDPQYAEVSSDFTDPTTASLVQMGDADKVNIFFLESFTGASGSGQIGISPGIPGTLGVKSNLNGVLINATATLNDPADYYARTTAEFAFHEMGHLLGLFHTTEKDFSEHDVLDDTPECTKAADDANGNNQADVDECPDGLNMMFWTNDFLQSKEILTDDQKKVLFYSVLATP